MRPFRAPREVRKISKGTSVTCQAEATPDLLQASSQEETALGTVRKPWKEKTWVIKETQPPEEEPNSLGDKGDEGADCVLRARISNNCREHPSPSPGNTVRGSVSKPI
jgi:hypothetical protein